MKRFNYASLTLIGLIILVAILRIGHVFPNNFAPVTALCLLGSAYFTRKWMAYLFPAMILLISDYFLGLGERPLEMIGVYASYLLIVWVGSVLRDKVKPVDVIMGSLLSSTIFYIVSNFFCWFASPYYSQDMNGIILNYSGALPFYRVSLISDLFFCGVFFTAFEMIKVKFPKFALLK